VTDDQLRDLWKLWDARPKDDRRTRAYVAGLCEWGHERGVAGHVVHRRLAESRREGLTYREAIEQVARTL